MKAERWQQVRAILDHAIAMPRSERSPYLEENCAGDQELRDELESLLRSHEEAGSVFLKEPAANLKALEPRISTRIGCRIGVYEIVEEIGHGGMGEVYRAVRADGQYEKAVAIKLVRGGYDRSFLLERFRHERQILASLDHPNIARLFDGGTTDEGVPYLVMELIEGKRLDSYCDEHQLSITERLQLFCQICSAVQYAHQRLVIHRDLKPGNVLVTADGVPKLLDFGIAKLIHPDGIAETTMVRPMTPEYASPEQIRGEPITTASDVYSLGVMLYKLLTGRSPYAETMRTPLDLSKIICETEPLRPSAAAESKKSPPNNIVAQSSFRAPAANAKLQRALQGDLDNIVLKALRKEPERRYGTVEQLAEDIRRHLQGLPVTATPDSASYRVGKFVRRHRAGVAAGAVIVCAIAAGVTATTVEARIARKQAEIARLERAKTEKRFNDVRELSDSLIFDVDDAIQNLPGATPARKLLLDRAVQYLDRVAEDAGGNPDLQRELAWGYQRVAVVQGSPTESNLGDPQAAEVSDRKALHLFEEVARANPTNVIDQLNVAMMHRILAFSALMQPAGRKDLQDAMAITERLMKTDASNPKVRSERAVEYQNRALMLDALGDRAHALDSYRDNQALRLDILRTNPEYRKIRRSSGMSTVMLGGALGRAGQRQEAITTIQQGIAFYDSVPKGDDDINVQRERTISRQKLAEVLLMNGDAKTALLNYKQTQDALAPMAKADPQNTMLQLDLASTEYHEARALAILGNYDAAIVKLQHAASVFVSLHANARSADDSPHGIGAIEIWLGDAYAGKADYRTALQQYGKAVEALGPETTAEMDADTRCELAEAYLKRGSALQRLGNLADAKNSYQKALDIVTPMAIPGHRDVPAQYVLADASAGLEKLLGELAHRAGNATTRAQLQGEIRSLHEKGLSAWAQIPNPTRIDPSGFLVVHGPPGGSGQHGPSTLQ